MSLDELALGCSFALTACSHVMESLILVAKKQVHVGELYLEKNIGWALIGITQLAAASPVMEGDNSETRNSCAMIHPSLLPFVKECLANDALNTQGGTLEIKRPKAR